MKLTIYKDIQGDYRWTLHSRNGKIVAASSEGFERRSGALKNWRLLCKGILANKVMEVSE